MKGITTIVSDSKLGMIARCCKINGITLVSTVGDIKPSKATLILFPREDLGWVKPTEALRKGFAIGTFISQMVREFDPDDDDNFQEHFVGIVDLGTGETMTWPVVDTYYQDKKNWEAKQVLPHFYS